MTKAYLRVLDELIFVHKELYKRSVCKEKTHTKRFIFTTFVICEVKKEFPGAIKYTGTTRKHQRDFAYKAEHLRSKNRILNIRLMLFFTTLYLT